jgi:hypothetical protein
MRRINLLNVRVKNLRLMAQYERVGIKLFTRALKEQAKVDFDPQPMIRAYIEYYQFVFLDSAKREYNQIRVQNPVQEKAFVPDGFFLNTWKEWIRVWVLDNLGWLIADVNANTLNQIQKVLASGLETGLQTFEIAEELQTIIPSKARALAIAKTEGTRANNMGKERSADDWESQTGVSLWKKWIHGSAKEPRTEHIYWDSQPPIPKGNLFPLGGGMTKPGDPNGGAAQTINCRCTIVFMQESYVRRYYPDAF